MTPRAVIAEDEPLLAQDLVSGLARAWPELHVVTVAGDGDSAVRAVLAERPHVVFLDIRMPGASGLDAAEAIAEDWPDDAGPLPLPVFVTAYDEYAVAAFDRAAFDYLLKPVDPLRLARTCERLRAALAVPSRDPGVLAAAERIAALLETTGARSVAAEPLRMIQAGSGQTVRMVNVDDVVYFEAADKYVRVVTADAEHLIRVSLRELLPRLDRSRFWPVHRGTVVRADAIDSAHRDESGKVTLKLRGRTETISVSRLHAVRFRAM